MVERPTEGVSPIGVLGSKAASLEKSVNRSINLFMYVIATLAVLTVATLIGLVLLQYSQNSKIDKALKSLNNIVVSNNTIGQTNASTTKKFGGAVEGLQEQLNNIQASDNESLYRVKQLEKAILGYVPPVPNSVIKVNQITVGFNPSDTPSPTPQPSPQPTQHPSYAPQPSPDNSQANPHPRPHPRPSKSSGIIPTVIPLPIPTPRIP